MIMTFFYYKGVAACTFLLIPSALNNTVITAALFPMTFLIIILLITIKTITCGCVSGGQSSDFNTGGGMGSGAMIIAIVTTTKELAKSLPLLLHGKNQIYLVELLQIREMILTLSKPGSLNYRNFHCDRDNKW